MFDNEDDYNDPYMYDELQPEESDGLSEYRMSLMDDEEDEDEDSRESIGEIKGLDEFDDWEEADTSKGESESRSGKEEPVSLRESLLNNQNEYELKSPVTKENRNELVRESVVPNKSAEPKSLSRKEVLSIEDYEDEEEKEGDIPKRKGRSKASSYSELNSQMNTRRKRTVIQEDEEYESKQKNKGKIIKILIAVGAILLVLSVLGNIKKSKSEKPADVQGSTQTVIVTATPVPSNEAVEPKVQVNANAPSSYSSIERGYVTSQTEMDLYVDTIYEDTIDINKFIEIRGGVVLPKFRGKPDHLGKEIEFIVDLEIYNKFVNGVKLGITYQAVQIENELFVTNVKLKE